MVALAFCRSLHRHPTQHCKCFAELPPVPDSVRAEVLLNLAWPGRQRTARRRVRRMGALIGYGQILLVVKGGMMPRRRTVEMDGANPNRIQCSRSRAAVHEALLKCLALALSPLNAGESTRERCPRRTRYSPGEPPAPLKGEMASVFQYLTG